MTEQSEQPGGPSPSNLSTEHQRDGDALKPSDTLDKGQSDKETIPRKSSLTKNA